jgi:hypothetical protein
MTVLNKRKNTAGFDVFWNEIRFMSINDALKKIFLCRSLSRTHASMNVDDHIPTIVLNGSKDPQEINTAIIKMLLQKDYGRYIVGMLFKGLLFID